MGKIDLTPDPSPGGEGLKKAAVNKICNGKFRQVKNQGYVLWGKARDIQTC
jgi:hypothetical protein